MKMINGVSMIPFGLLAGFADQNEIRIIELAENGFRFRMAKNQKNIENTERFRICFYDGEISDYREIILQKFHIEKPEEEKFYFTYSVFTEQEDFQKRSTRTAQTLYPIYSSEKQKKTRLRLHEALTGYSCRKR